MVTRAALLGGALALLAMLLPMSSDAAWRRTSRADNGALVNDLAVCEDGIHVILATWQRLWLTEEHEDPDRWQEWLDSRAPYWYREGLLVSTDIDHGGEFDHPVPAGDILLELSHPVPQSDDPADLVAPLVDADDPRLDGIRHESDSSRFYYYYLLEERLRWSAPLEAGDEVYIWVADLGRGPWSLGSLDEGGEPEPVTVSNSPEDGCNLFEEPPPPVPDLRLDANVYSPRDELFPQFPGFTVFHVSGAELVPGSVRFGAPGRERTAWVIGWGTDYVGIADLAPRGLGCSATEASVTARTTAGEQVSVAAPVVPVCPFPP